jgi:thioredoxin
MYENSVMKIIDRTDFDDIVDGRKGAFIVDLWASWCMPCRMSIPLIEKLARELDGRVSVVKLDYDVNQDLKEAYGFLGVPTLLFFSDGKLTGQITGLGNYGNLRESVDGFVTATTGVSTERLTEQEAVFKAAADKAEAAFERDFFPVADKLSRDANRLEKNKARTKARANQALRAGRSTSEKTERRVAHAQARYDEFFEQVCEAFSVEVAPIEAAYITAIETAAGLRSVSIDSGPSGGAVCAIGDKTCAA